MNALSEDSKPIYDRALLLHGHKRDEILTLEEVRQYGIDSFSLLPYPRHIEGRPSLSSLWCSDWLGLPHGLSFGSGSTCQHFGSVFGGQARTLHILSVTRSGLVLPIPLGSMMLSFGIYGISSGCNKPMA
jgi:hypothetical protein